MGSVLVGLVMLIGLVGVVLPFLPGTALILGAGIAWAVFVQDGGTGRWVVVALMALLFVIGAVAKYALPGRMLTGRLERTTLLAGLAGAVIGLVVFFPLGFLIGGVLGVYLEEARRLRSASEAVTATVHVLKAIGLGVVAELTAGVLMVGVWVSAVIVT